MPRNDTSAKVRITDQFRSGQAMVYDLKCESIRLTISMSSTKEAVEEWNVEALAKQLPGPPKLRATGSSRSEAFGVLAEAWRAQGAEGYPPLDWGAIREALVAVRAV
jgi:hypothetical protein